MAIRFQTIILRMLCFLTSQITIPLISDPTILLCNPSCLRLLQAFIGDVLIYLLHLPSITTKERMAVGGWALSIEDGAAYA